MDLYKIIITPDAEKDLVELRNYIADVLLARDTARSYIRTIRKEIATLNEMPARYKPVDDEPWHTRGIRRIIANNFYVYYRIDEGEHVIPAPLGQLRRDFAGYFMDPIKQFIHKARGNAVETDGDQRQVDDGPNDRTVVRPTFSYFGSFTITEQVIRDIIKIAAEEYESHLVVVDRMNNGKQTNMSVTIDVMAVRDPESIDKCMDLQQDVYGALVNMTAFTIDSVNVRIRDIVRDREEMLSRKLH